MAENIDDLTITYVENGIDKVKECAKEVLTRGAWTTIVYKYQNWDFKKEEYGPYGYSVRRYQKRNGEYQLRSKFNISNDDQARKVIEVLTKWVGKE